MDIEFHYYTNYLIAVRAGFSPAETLTIATAAQAVDDNTQIFEVDKGKPTAYRNYISQTMNILKPKPKLIRIYPVFHFIPGDPMASAAERRDGALHWLNTTADSSNAQAFLVEALKTGDLYRIGIACHAYADTWAHQNFVGYFHSFNSIKGLLEAACPNIGHADAGHNPDWVALVWQDRRLRGARERVDNRERFLKAAEALFVRLRKHIGGKVSPTSTRKDAAALVAELDAAIGPRDQTNELKNERIARYRQLAETAAYCGQSLPEYLRHGWLTEAVDIDVRFLPDLSDSFLMRWDPITDKYSWRSGTDYRSTPWFRFQEAVKAHQAAALAILAKTTGNHVDLDRTTF